MKKQNQGAIIYQAPNGAIEFRGDFKHETIWANQSQIAELFDIERSVVTKHIKNIFSDKELSEEVVSAKFAQTTQHGAIKGKTQTKDVTFYNLDIILAVGYKTKSSVAVNFRQWATKTLRNYIVKGYAINPKRIKENYAEFQKTINNIKALLPKNILVDNQSILELVSSFADTWLSLKAYDENKLSAKGATKKSVKLTGEQLQKVLSEFRTALIKKKEATEIFGQERKIGEILGIFGNVMQTFGQKELYPTLEEKAAHLLYFMVKNHPYIDGNKRSGAYSFVWFLNYVGLLNRNKITPTALTALTLFVAESDPKDKEKMIRLILQLLKK